MGAQLQAGCWLRRARLHRPGAIAHDPRMAREHDGDEGSEAEAGYRAMRDGHWRAVVRAHQARRIAAALWRLEGCSLAGSGGRSRVYRFALATGETGTEEEWGIVRPCRRGGLWGRLARDAYVLRNRPLQEFRVHRYCQERGLPVPEVLGVGWRRSGLLVRGALATRYVEARSLQEWLSRQDAPPGDVLLQVGKVIRDLHDAGVWHADLQVRNILVDGGGAVHVLDFDKARRAGRLGTVARARNLMRLRRSFEKNGLSLAAYQRVVEGYGPLRAPAWLDGLYRLKGRLSDAVAGRRRAQ